MNEYDEFENDGLGKIRNPFKRKKFSKKAATKKSKSRRRTRKTRTGKKAGKKFFKVPKIFRKKSPAEKSARRVKRRARNNAVKKIANTAIKTALIIGGGPRAVGEYEKAKKIASTTGEKVGRFLRKKKQAKSVLKRRLRNAEKMGDDTGAIKRAIVRVEKAQPPRARKPGRDRSAERRADRRRKQAQQVSRANISPIKKVAIKKQIVERGIIENIQPTVTAEYLRAGLTPLEAEIGAKEIASAAVKKTSTGVEEVAKIALPLTALLFLL